MKNTLKILLVFVLMAIYAIYAGFVLSILWGWFVVETFSLPALSIPVAIGINSIIRLVVIDVDYDVEQKEFSTRIVQSVTTILTKPTLFFVMGWIVVQFI